MIYPSVLSIILSCESLLGILKLIVRQYEMQALIHVHVDSSTNTYVVDIMISLFCFTYKLILMIDNNNSNMGFSSTLALLIDNNNHNDSFAGPCRPLAQPRCNT